MSRDRAAQLYRTYGPMIYSRCCQILGNPALAEDATQETFVRVYRHLDRLPPSYDALAWIYRIATNYCLNELRNAKHRPSLVDRLPDHPCAEGHDDQVADRDLARRLITSMPEKLRAVVWLHHVDGLGQEEVAHVLGMSRRSIVYYLAEFRQRAQRFLSRSAPGAGS